MLCHAHVDIGIKTQSSIVEHLNSLFSNSSGQPVESCYLTQ